MRAETKVHIEMNALYDTDWLVYLMFKFTIFFIPPSVETARIQKEAAVIDARLEEHSRACSELRRLQVNDTSLNNRTLQWKFFNQYGVVVAQCN